MAQFNPITDLMPMDSSEESVDKSSEQIESIRIQLTQTRDSLSNVVNIIKVKNSLLERDLDKIENLNERLKRTIPRIPIMRGMAGVQFSDLTEEKKKRGGLNIPMLPPPPPKTKEVTYKRPGLKAAADAIGNFVNAALVLSYVGSLKNIFRPKVQAPVPANKIVPVTPGVLTPKKEKLIERVLSFLKTKKLARTSKKSGYAAFSRDASKIKPETLVERITKAYEKNFGKEFNPVLSRRGNLVRQGNKLLEQEQKSNRLAKIFKFIKTKPQTRGRVNKRITRKLLNQNKLEKILRDADSKLFKSGQEADSIAAVVRKVLKEGDVGSANLTKSEKSTFQAFKKYLDDAIEEGIFTQKDVGELRKFLRQSDVGGENINFEKVLEQLRKNVFGGSFFETSKPGAFLNTKSMNDDIAMLNTDTGVTNTVIFITNPPTA